LLVPSQRPSEESGNSLAHAVFTTVPSGRTVYYTVRRGESVQIIAARYGVSAPDVRRWNNLTQNGGLAVGKRLRIVSDIGPVAKTRKLRRASTVKSTRARSDHRAASD
jgi:LysM repeat protein